MAELLWIDRCHTLSVTDRCLSHSFPKCSSRYKIQPGNFKDKASSTRSARAGSTSGVRAGKEPYCVLESCMHLWHKGTKPDPVSVWHQQHNVPIALYWAYHLILSPLWKGCHWCWKKSENVLSSKETSDNATLVTWMLETVHGKETFCLIPQNIWACKNTKNTGSINFSFDSRKSDR